ncbi:MAG: DUF4974 domain-containing protein [Chitinophagaceae bacterium]|nr:DUF4974 domain-containing protein [Chitinophagaceae bacterium]
MDNLTPDIEILKRYIRNECSPEEAEKIVGWLADGKDPARMLVFNQLLEEGEAGDHFSAQELQTILQASAGRILHRIEEKQPVARVYTFRRLKWSAAAAVFLLLSVAAYFRLQDRSIPVTTVQNKESVHEKKEITPGADKAVLTLANGQTVVLDEADNGNVAQEGNTKVIKLDGQLSYRQTGNATAVSYNTITTPKGGQYKLVLADGTQVWLNAASSLRFPVSFTGTKRTVELTGEGYFEVAQVPADGKGGKIPFIVKILNAADNTGEVEVLGTHFNIMAYGDEGVVKTTLLEGSVKVKNNTRNTLLKPGQQANLRKDVLYTNDHVDVEEIVAWKDGYFQFDRKAPIEQVMRQIARWYDVEIHYEGSIPNRRFGGKIARDSRLQDVLKMLELNNIHFSVQGRVITVTP